MSTTTITPKHKRRITFRDETYEVTPAQYEMWRHLWKSLLDDAKKRELE